MNHRLLECCSQGWPCEGQPTGSPKLCQSVRRVFDHIPYQKPFPPSLLSLVRWSYLRRILIVSVFVHFGMMAVTVLFWTFTAAKRYRNLSRWSVGMEEPKSWHCVRSSTSLKSNYTSEILNVFSCSFCNWIMTHHCLIGHLSRLICRCFLCQLVSDEFELTHNRTQVHGVWLRYFMHVNFSDF